MKNLEQLRESSFSAKDRGALQDKLKAKTRRVKSGCLEWVGHRMPSGYGVTNLRSRTVLAHRAAFELATGRDPEGWCICHTCDNRPCVEPTHLFAGTRAENARDARVKGRSTPPARPRAVRDAELVYRLHDAGLNATKIALALSVSSSVIRSVIKDRPAA